MSNVESAESVQNVEQESEWETTQQIMIDRDFMDQIVAIYLSGRLQMKNKTTELRYNEYISTSKGHGIRMRGFDRNVCIEKRKRIEK
jgi:hypothetical protein